MTNRMRLAKLQGSIKDRLKADVDRLQADFFQTISDEELRSYIALVTWLRGYSHMPRPLPTVIAKAFAFREKMPHDLIEAYRRVAAVEGELPKEFEEITEELLRIRHGRNN